jgi:lipoate-protein ligase A
VHILPTRTASAAANMATDLMLLESYPKPDTPRLRHYGWSGPAWSFGLSQTFNETHERILALPCELVRRPTGGGLVDHLDDWTYALVVPPGARGYRDGPAALYRLVHEQIAAAFAAQGLASVLHAVKSTDGLHAVCFEQPEQYDLTLPGGAKIAGAAQKRTRDGLLVQGSITRRLPVSINWIQFADNFAVGLSQLFNTSPTRVSWPAWDEQRLARETARFASEAWNKKRRHVLDV